VKALVSLASLQGTTVAELANSTGIKVSLDA
jgi:hypothetical protein